MYALYSNVAAFYFPFSCLFGTLALVILFRRPHKQRIGSLRVAHFCDTTMCQLDRHFCRLHCQWVLTTSYNASQMVEIQLTLLLFVVDLYLLLVLDELDAHV